MTVDVFWATVSDVVRWGFLVLLLLAVAVVLGMVKDTADRERAQRAAWKRHVREVERARVREAWDRWS